MNYQPGDILGGKYKILGMLGGGAMGKLYKAENITIQKHVAIKVMQGDFAQNEEYQQRFMREAQAAASLEHFNICTIMDYDMTEKGDAYIVMELLSGEPLSDRIKRLGTLDPMSACLIMRQLLSALGCAHAKGIVHRDIKPDNVFLVHHEDRDDFVKLIDFGVAHIEQPQIVEGSKPLTQSGQIYGTPQYLSPEQAEGSPIDYRADLYATGIILYEMLVGTPPFEGKSFLDLLVKQVREPAPHLPSTIVQSDRLDEIIQKLLAKNPDDRYGSAQEVITHLDEIILLLSAETPLASASFAALSGSLAANLQKLNSQVNSAQKQSQPNKVIVALIIVCVLILAGVLAMQILKNAQPEEPIAEEVPEQAPAEAVDEEPLEELSEAEALALQDPDPAEGGEDGAEPLKPEIPPPEPYVTDEAFGIASDAVLSENTKLYVASEAFFNKKYATALAILGKVKDDYWNHPNFVRLYLISASSAQKPKEAAESLAHLLAIEPLAVFNPAVKEVAENMFDDDDNVEALGNEIVNQQGAHSKTAMAWLIIRSDYDRNESRLNRMIDVYDRLNNVHTDENGQKTETPAWMMRSVNVWRLDKKECQRRLALLTQLEQMKGSKDNVYQNVLVPLHNMDSKECMVSRKRANCNACLREWLDEVVSEYEGVPPKAKDKADAKDKDDDKKAKADAKDKDDDKAKADAKDKDDDKAKADAKDKDDDKAKADAKDDD